MDIIQKFCSTKNPELLHDLPYHIKYFFIEAAKYSIKHKKGHQDIAKIVIKQLNIKGDVVIARFSLCYSCRTPRNYTRRLHRLITIYYF